MLKQAYIKPPTLITFQSKKPIRIETDASNLVLGACITQEKDRKQHPITYYSRKFTLTEEQYNVYNKELLAIVLAIKYQQVYAQSCSKLTIYTDYKNLTYFTTTKVLNSRQVRQLEMLGEYKFKILYTPRKDNSRVDALSCRSNLASKKTVNAFAILGINKDRLLRLS